MTLDRRRNWAMGVAALLLATLLAAAAASTPAYAPHHTYRYAFEAQLSHALAPPDAPAPQQSATRISAALAAHFADERLVHMQLQKVRIADVHGRAFDARQMQPADLFEAHALPAAVQQALELPFHCDYVEGGVRALRFHAHDLAWSKNLKRAAAGLLQANLQAAKAEGAQTDVFSVPEVTPEGACHTFYVIQKPQHATDQQPVHFNVTKSIEFARCSATADVAYGQPASVAQEQQCHQCVMARRPRSAAAVDAAKLGACQPACRPNQPAGLRRSTVVRMQLHGRPGGRFVVRRAHSLSHYAVQARSPAQRDAVAHSVALAQLQLQSAEQSGDAKPEAAPPAAAPDEPLLYSAEWDLLEKRFYMYGDDQFADAAQQPFARVQRKAARAAAVLRHLRQQWAEPQLGYELDSAQQFGQLVEALRQASGAELEQMEQETSAVAPDDPQVQSVWVDALATAATRNTLHRLAQKVRSGLVDDAQAAKALKIFQLNQHSPSDRQTDLLEGLAQWLARTRRSDALQQVAWLAFSASVAHTCPHQLGETSETALPAAHLCPGGKKAQYARSLQRLFDDAASTYEKVLALKCVGNAGLAENLPRLVQVVGDARQPMLVRMEAVDAMRRMGAVRAAPIRAALQPLFLDQRAAPQLRMAAFAMLVHTRPAPAQLDQLTLPLLMERSAAVRAFALATMEALAASPLPDERQTAAHLRNALKLVKADARAWQRHAAAAAAHRLPIYAARADESADAALLHLAAFVSPTNALPVHLIAAVRRAMNGQATSEPLSVQFSQKNLEQWFAQLAQLAAPDAEDTKEDKKEDKKEYKLMDKIKAIFSSLGIQSRRAGHHYVSSEEDEDQPARDQPYGMLVVRTDEIDQLILPVTAETLPEGVRRILEGQKPTVGDMAQLRAQLGGEAQASEAHAALSLGQRRTKVATSAGVPLAVRWDSTLVGSVRAQVQPREGRARRLRARASAIATHTLRTECWTPVGVAGVESTRTLELAAPLDLELAEDAQKGATLVIRLPTVDEKQDESDEDEKNEDEKNENSDKKDKNSGKKDKMNKKETDKSNDDDDDDEQDMDQDTDQSKKQRRILGLHTLPVTYSRRFSWSDHTYKPMRMKTVRSAGMRPLQRELHAAADAALAVEGQLHVAKEADLALHALYAAENNVHVYYRPQPSSPAQIVLKAEAQAFVPAKHETEDMELDSFYDKSEEKDAFEDEDGDEEDEEEEKIDRMDKIAKYDEIDNGDENKKDRKKKNDKKNKKMNKNNNDKKDKKKRKSNKDKEDEQDSDMNNMSKEERKQQLRARLAAYDQRPAYAHQLKLSAEAACGGRRHQVAARVGATCDAALGLCRLSARLARSEDREAVWAGSADAALLMPAGSAVGDKRKAGDQPLHKDGLIVQLKASAKHLNRAADQVTMWLKAEPARHAHAINQYDLVADYELSPRAQHAVNGLYELAKARFYWQLEQRATAGRPGQVRARLVVDAREGRVANLSVRTAHESLRARSIVLPASALLQGPRALAMHKADNELRGNGPRRAADGELGMDSNSQEQSCEVEEQDKSAPIMATKVEEMKHKICFSLKPVKQCPEGTIPSDPADSQKTQVQFACASRGSHKAARMMRQVRHATIHTDDLDQSMSLDVLVPNKCISVY